MKRRSFGVAAIICGAGISHAQVGAFSATSTFIRSLQEKNIVSRGDVPNPMQPKTLGSDTTELDKAVPEPQDEDKSFKLIHAKRSNQSGDDVAMSGGTEFMYKGYHVFADAVEGNLATSIFTVQGDVKIIGKQSLITGERISIDFNKRIYHATNSRQVLSPELLKGPFLKDLYSHGRESYGSANEQQTLFGGITSCDLLRPHYEIDADNIIVRPGKRAIFRKARLRLFGRTIIKIPYLSIPLDTRSYKNLPVIGQSPQEGYYIKFRYGVPLRGDNDVYARLDYMEKLGLGIGADYLYRSKVVDGVLQVYTIAGPGKMLKVTDEHHQMFKWGTLALRTNYENNNYLTAPGSIVESTQALLTFPQHGNAMTRLTLNQSGNSNDGYSTSNQSISLADSRRFGTKIQTSVNVDYQKNGTTYQGGSGPISQSTENMNLKVDATDDLTRATANLTYQRAIPIGSTRAVFGSNDQTPVVSLATDARRLIGGKIAENWPFQSTLSLGEFSDQLGGGHISRDFFDFSLAKPDRSTGRLHSDINAEFKQGIYSDGTAQYVLNYGQTESYRMGPDTAFNFRYNYLRPYGYTPLSLDRSGETNLATADLSYRPIRSVVIGAQSGYDILRLKQGDEPWQPVGVRMEFQPKPYFLLRAQSTYDTFQGAWSNVRVDLSYKPGATFLSVGAYYDGIRHLWSNVNIFLDALKIGRTKIGAILNYNGFTQQFDSQQYSLTYDLHCAEAVFTMTAQQTGFNPGNTYQFFIRLKAFPFDSLFGAGSRGQPLGTGTGFGY